MRNVFCLCFTISKVSVCCCHNLTFQTIITSAVNTDKTEPPTAPHILTWGTTVWARWAMTCKMASCLCAWIIMLERCSSVYRPLSVMLWMPTRVKTFSWMNFAGGAAGWGTPDFPMLIQDGSVWVPKLKTAGRVELHILAVQRVVWRRVRGFMNRA